MNQALSERDYHYLGRCLELAEESYQAGDEPFGSVLVNSKGELIAEARNRVREINVLAHPEYELAQWATENLNAEERANTRMYTSGEHCPMCSAAHGWVGLGTLIYLSSAEQLNQWLTEIKAPPASINFIPAKDIIKNTAVKGPGTGVLLQKIKELHIKSYQKK